jgi:hypothetical protein
MATQPIFDDVKPWPTQQQPLATVGHNKPPLEEVVRAEFRDELLRDHADFMVRFEDVVDCADRVQVTNEDELGRAGDLVKLCRDIGKHVDATHKAVKDHYLNGGRVADAEKNALAERLSGAKRKFENVMNEFVAKREAEQRAARLAEEAEQRRQAQEAAAAEALRQEAADANDAEAMAAVPVIAAPAAAVRSEPVRSDAGATVSGKQVWNSQVTDYVAAFAEVSDNPKVREAIDKAIAGLVRAGKRELPGCRIWPTTQANVR